MKVWITRYALTDGVFVTNATRHDAHPNMIECDGPVFYHGCGKDWHLSRESAVERAKEMQTRKVVSMMKRIERVKQINFDTQVPV